jgi:hypothetical protein
LRGKEKERLRAKRKKGQYLCGMIDFRVAWSTPVLSYHFSSKEKEKGFLRNLILRGPDYRRTIILGL